MSLYDLKVKDTLLPSGVEHFWVKNKSLNCALKDRSLEPTPAKIVVNFSDIMFLFQAISCKRSLAKLHNYSQVTETSNLYSRWHNFKYL